MSKPALMKKVSSLLVSLMLLSALVPILAFAAQYDAKFDGKNVSGSVYTQTYNETGVTLYVYNLNGTSTGGQLTTSYVTYNTVTKLYEYSINASQPVSPVDLYKIGLKELPSDTIEYLVNPGYQATLTSVAVDSETYSLDVGQSHQTVVTASYSDETTRTVTSDSSYVVSGDPAIASVSTAGLVTAVAPGTTVITATYGGISKQVNVTVNAPQQPATLDSINVDSGSYALDIGQSHQTAVTASYSDNTTRDVTADSSYTSGDSAIADVSTTGVVTAVAPGTTSITVTYGGISKQVNVTVNAVKDTTAPVWLANKSLTATNVNQTTLTLNWTAATDANTVSYKVYQGSNLLNTVTAVTYNVTGLSSSTSYNFSVYAIDSLGNENTTPLTVSVTTRSIGGGSIGSGGSGPGGSTGTTTNSDGSISVTNGQVDATTLKNAFANKTEVTLVVKGDTVSVPASALVDAAKKAGSTLTIKSDNGTYVLPLSTFDFEALAKELGTTVNDLKFTVNVKKLSGDAAKPVADAVKKAGGKAISEAVDFSITFEGKDGKKKEITTFNSYVKRVLPLTASSKNATVVLFDPTTQTFSFVPASISDKEATFWKKGNSVYTVIEHSKSFSDIATHWAKADIEQLAGKLIIDGVTDTTFQADRNITRAEFAALVVRSLGLSPVSGTAKFNDVKSVDWFAGVVGAAAQAGIVNGYEDGSFRPQAQITREELAAMVVRAYEYAGGKTAIDSAAIAKALSTYSDAKNIVWGQKEVAIALSSGLLNGMTDTTLVTDGQATRAQAATMLKRFLSKVNFIN
ncbi:S-layer homology domain-containing protein [Paenibacillus hodogayensis]|uniref:S-layer homology domain-containing protein n=1 Tax=Paenibacillus hodogayensis TaxID=279208 RepID=A0ABV5VSE9_9BACL